MQSDVGFEDACYCTAAAGMHEKSFPLFSCMEIHSCDSLVCEQQKKILKKIPKKLFPLFLYLLTYASIVFSLSRVKLARERESFVKWQQNYKTNKQASKQRDMKGIPFAKVKLQSMAVLLLVYCLYLSITVIVWSCAAAAVMTLQWLYAFAIYKKFLVA